MLLVTPSAVAEILEISPKTILIYQTKSGQQERQFVLRIARFKPDIVLEWESLSHQGTVHLHRKAVEKATRFSVSKLFDPGVDSESGKETTKWLSRKMYDELINQGKVKITLNKISTQFQLKEKSTRQLVWNKVEIEVPVIVVEDSRRGVWAFHANPENPILIEYTTPYYHEKLARISTDGKNRLRWIRQLPPIR